MCIRRPVPLTEHAVFKGIVYKKLQPKELQQQQEQLILPASDPAAGTAAATQKQTGAHSRQAPSASDTAAGLVTASTAAGNGAAVSTNLPAVAGAAAAVPLVELRSLPDSDPRVDADRVAVLVAEVAREGHSTLVFCASRNACQSCAGGDAASVTGSVGRVPGKPGGPGVIMRLGKADVLIWLWSLAFLF